MAKIDGKLIVLQIGGYTVTGQTTGSINFSADMLDATTKDSAGWKEFVAGEKNATISVGGLYDPAASTGAEEIIAYLFVGSALTWKFGQLTAGSTYWEGSGLITSININGDKNTLSAYTVEIQNTGTPVQHAVIGS